MEQKLRPCVLVFAGLDPSGGAGISADIDAIGAVGAHALPVVTALTVQDNDRVYAVNPVGDAIIARQAGVLLDKIPVAAVKIGIVGNRENALVIRDVLHSLGAQTESHGSQSGQCHAVAFGCPSFDYLTGCIPAGLHHALADATSESCLTDHLLLVETGVQLGFHHIAVLARRFLVKLQQSFHCLYFQCHNCF